MLVIAFLLGTELVAKSFMISCTASRVVRP
jgi:hypothetical protein